MDRIRIRQALISVSDKTGLAELARGLAELGVAILSTGGTAKLLTASGVKVTEVAEYTGYPEMLDGRLKTLHPKVHGGLLARRDLPAHMAAIEGAGIAPIDLVVVNLYPFQQTIARPGCTFAEAVENIDIGGPTMVRAAAKNHAGVAVLTDPADYAAVLGELRASDGALGAATRLALATKAFAHTAAYDAGIANYLTSLDDDSRPTLFPETLTLQWHRAQAMRYGENPHQEAAFYRDADPVAGSLARYEQVQGKELSYNNLLDADAALFGARALGPSSLVIVKHRIPSGAATAAGAAEAFEAAWASDPVAGFGGVVAFTGTIDAACARAMASRFLEVVVAHGVDEEARAILSAKANLRVLTVAPEAGPRPRLEVRGIDGGLLVQQGDLLPDDESGWRVVTKRAPSEEEMAGLRFAFRVVRGVVSNAIVVASGTATLGIGGGRTSRVDACKDAVAKAGERARGAVAASDAFFPFPDGPEVLAEAGVTAMVQPGGSVKDAAVVESADARGIAMVFTGRRHFRH